MYIGSLLSDRRHQTYGWIEGELFRLIPGPDDNTIIADWQSQLPGADHGKTQALGLTPRENAFGQLVAADRPERLFVQVEDRRGEMWVPFPSPPMFGPPAPPPPAPDPLAGLTTAVGEAVPEDWRTVRLECLALGTRSEITATVMTERGEFAWIPPAEVIEWVRRIRRTDYAPETQTWTVAEYEQVRDGEPRWETGHVEPEWKFTRADPDARYRECYDELRYFPRDRQATPEWLLKRAWEYHLRQLEVRDPDAISERRDQFGMRLAAVFDGVDADQKPVVYRPALSQMEKRMVLDYLAQGHTVLAAFGTAEDELDPSRPAEVPNRFVTDGLWIWPMAIAYYLDVHDVPPPQDLLDHISVRWLPRSRESSGAGDRARYGQGDRQSECSDAGPANAVRGLRGEESPRGGAASQQEQLQLRAAHRRRVGHVGGQRGLVDGVLHRRFRRAA